MLNAKRLFGFLEKGVLPEMTAADAEPVARHADGSACYTQGCRRGGIPWANIQRHNAREKAQMKFDFHPERTGSVPSVPDKSEALAKKLRAASIEYLAKLMHETEDDPSRQDEFKAVEAEITRRSSQYYSNLGERA